MALVLITEPSIEPLTLAEAKEQCGVTFSDLDALLTRLISVARSDCESETGRAIITQTWQLELDAWPCHPHILGVDRHAIHLPKPPVQTVSSVKHIDSGGTERTLVENTDYVVQKSDPTTRIAPAWGTTWPEALGVPGAIKVRFVAGYGVDIDAVNKSPVGIQLRHGMLMRLASYFRNHEDEITGPAIARVDLASTRLFSKHAAGRVVGC